MAGQLLVLGQVDVPLAVLDADPYRQGLRLHGDPGGVEYLEGVPGAVAQGQNHLPDGEAVGSAGTRHLQGGHMPLLNLQPRQPVAEADIAAQVLQLPPEGDQGPVEVVGTHVGLGVHQDALRRAVGHQGLQDEAVAGVPGAGVQLPVGEGPGAALAELDVGLRVQGPCGPEPLHVRLAALHVPPPLQQNGPGAAPGQGQGAEEASGPGPHHHRRDGRGLQRHRQAVGPFLRPGDLLAPAPPEDLGLVLHADVEGIYQMDPLPGVHRPAEDTHLPDVPGGDPEQCRGPLGQQALVLLQRQFHSFYL